MNIFDLQATISLNSDAFMSGVGQAQAAFGGLGSSISAGTVAAGQVLGNFVTAAAGTVKDFAGSAIETGKAYEAGISQIAATLGYSLDELADPTSEASQNMAALSAKAEEMGRTTSFTAADAADGLNILAMAGFDAGTAIEMIPTVLDLAKAGSLGLGEAASYVAGSMKGFTGEASGFADALEASGAYADIMAAGATKANTSVGELGAALSGASAIASSYGQSSTETGVALLRLAEQSVTGSAAATALSAVMKDLYAGTDQAKDALNALGVSTYDSSGEARDLNVVIGDLDAALSQLTTQERADLENVIFGIQGKSAFDKMVATSGDKLDSFYEAIETSSGSAAQQAETMADNVQGAGDSLQSALEGFEIAIYKHLSGPLQEAQTMGADALNALTSGFESGGFRGALESLGAFASETFEGLWEKLKLPPELEGLSDAFNSLKTALSGLRDSVGADLAESFGTIAGAVKSFIDAFADVDFGSMDGVAQAAARLIDAFKNAAADRMEAIASGVSAFVDAFRDVGAADAIGRVAQGAKDLLAAFLTAGADVVESVAGSVLDFVGGFVDGGGADAIANVAKNAADLFGAFLSASSEVIEAVGEGVKKFLDVFPSEKIGEIIGGIAKSASDLFGAFSGTAGTFIKEIADAVKGFVDGFDNSAAAGIIEDIAGVVGDLFGYFSAGFAGIIERIGEAFEGFGSKLADLWNSAGPSMSELGEAVHAVVENIRQSVADFMAVVQPIAEWLASVFSVGIQVAVENIVTTFGSLFDAALNVFTSIQNLFAGFVALMHGDVTGAVEQFKSAWDNIAAFFGNLGDLLVQPFKNLASILGDEGNKGVAAIKAPFETAWSWFKEIGANLIEGLKQGIASAWSGLTSWVSEKFNGLISGVMNIFGEHSPSKVFAGIGANLILGMRNGWGAEFGGLESQVDRDVRRLTDTARIGFEDSAIGRSSAAGISSMFAASEGSGRGDPVSINLVLDGDVAATALYDPLRRTAFQRGQNSMEAAYA